MPTRFSVFGQHRDLPAADPEIKLVSRPGGWWILEQTLADGSIRRVRLAISRDRQKLSAHVGGQAWFGELKELSRGAAAGGTDADLVAQFPGKVRKILVKEGESVVAGAPLLLMEAMKMEFAIKAPKAGKVTKLRVAEGQQVSPGDRFVDLGGLGD